MVVQHAIYTK